MAEAQTILMAGAGIPGGDGAWLDGPVRRQPGFRSRDAS